MIYLIDMTPKRDKFCELYVSLGNGAEAYRQAYEVRATTKDATCQNNAYKLLQDNDIITRVEILKTEASKSHGIDRAFIINGLLEVISDADYTFKLGKDQQITKEGKQAFFRIMQQTKNTDKLRAFEMLIKMFGFNQPEKIEHKHTIKTHDTKWG